MQFTKSLIKGKLIKRYKRFFTDIDIGKEIVTAHCPNTGSMKGLLDKGNEVYILSNNDPKRKLTIMFLQQEVLVQPMMILLPSLFQKHLD